MYMVNISSDKTDKEGPQCAQTLQLKIIPTTTLDSPNWAECELFTKILTVPLISEENNQAHSVTM